MWHGGYFNGQVLLWTESSPIFQGQKNNFTMAPLHIFGFWDAKSEKRPMEIGKIIEDIRGTGVCH